MFITIFEKCPATFELNTFTLVQGVYLKTLIPAKAVILMQYIEQYLL